MKRIIKSILFGGIFSGLMLSFTFGNNPSRVSKERNNDFSFKNDSHYIIHNDTFKCTWLFKFAKCDFLDEGHYVVG